MQETAALNLTSVPRPKMDMRLDDFSIEMDEEEGSRWFTVRGTAVERFAQMTNWDYYEAVSACCCQGPAACWLEHCGLCCVRACSPNALGSLLCPPVLLHWACSTGSLPQPGMPQVTTATAAAIFLWAMLSA